MSLIDCPRSRFGVEPICRTLGWNVSSYYARKQRPPSRRELEDRRLLGEIRRVHNNYEGLRRPAGVAPARPRRDRGGALPGRAADAHGIRGAQPSKRRRCLTVADPAEERPADLVDCNFHAAGPNRL
jgi:putative transposase